VYHYLLKKVESKTDESDIRFQVAKEEFLDELLDKGVTLGNFIEVLEPLSQKVEVEDQDGYPFGNDPHYPFPEVYYSTELKLRWRIEYTKEVEYNIHSFDSYLKQFGAVIDLANFNFSQLAFTFEDKDLLVKFLKEKYNELYRDPNMISLVSDTKLAYKDRIKSLNAGEMPYLLIKIGWGNEGVITPNDLKAESGLTGFNFYKIGKNFREDLESSLKIKKHSGALINISKSEEKITLNPAYFNLSIRPL